MIKGALKSTGAGLADKSFQDICRAILRKVRNGIFYTTISDWYVADLSNESFADGASQNIEVVYYKKPTSVMGEWLKEKGRLYPWIYSEKELAIAELSGHPYFASLRGGEIVGFLKVGIGDVYVADFRKPITFNEKTAFIYDTFVLPCYRGQGIAPAMIGEAVKYLKERDYKILYCHIESWNRASLRTYEKIGFALLGQVRYIRIFIISFFLVNGCRLGISLIKQLDRLFSKAIFSHRVGGGNNTVKSGFLWVRQDN